MSLRGGLTADVNEVEELGNKNRSLVSFILANIWIKTLNTRTVNEAERRRDKNQKTLSRPFLESRLKRELRGSVNEAEFTNIERSFALFILTNI